MKGRPKRIRKISGMPAVSGFMPYGVGNDSQELESVFLLYEEYESFKLLDYEKHTQEEAAVLMGVSRPTLTRIYMSARAKLALALVEGRSLAIEGGKVELDGQWMVCKNCGAIFSKCGTRNDICALCGSKDIEVYSIDK